MRPQHAILVAILIATAGWAAWHLFGHSEPIMSRGVPDAHQRDLENPARRTSGSPSPIKSAAYDDPIDSRPGGTRPSETTPRWSVFEFRGDTSESLLAEFAHLPSTIGKWAITDHDPAIHGPISLYAYAPEVLDQAIDRYIQGYYEKNISPDRPVDMRSSTAPDLSQWPVFSKWLKEAWTTYVALKRKHVALSSALPVEGRVTLSAAESDSTTHELNRLTEKLTPLWLYIEDEMAAFARLGLTEPGPPAQGATSPK